MIRSVVLQPTVTAQWQNLLQEAQKACSHPLGPDLESYLVFLLTRFTSEPELASGLLAMEYLTSLELCKTERATSLQTVGDQCLLLAGLFPGRARQRRVRISYYVHLGQNAYSQLSALCHQPLALLYNGLSSEFVALMDTLQAMHELEDKAMFLDPLQAEELWQDTRSPHALQTLRRNAPLAPILPLLPPSLIKH